MTKQILYTVFFTALLALLAVTSGNGQSFTDPHIREGDPLPQAPMPGNDGVQLGKVAAPLQIPESSKSVTIDGYIDEASEWSDAEQLDLPFTQFVGQQPKSKVWIKNDYCGLYIAFEMHFEHIPIHYPGYRGIIERGCMLNMWIDRDSDQVFDFDPTPDPVLSFPSLNNPTKAAFGHRSLPGWYWWNYIDGLRSHAPWMTAPVDITNSQVVRRFDYNNDVVYIEGYVDFRVAPIDLVPGSTFRMRLNGYADFSNSGTETLLINGCWPTQGPNWTYWFDPLPTGDRLETTSLANVPQPTDDYDVLSAELAPDPDYGAFAYESGEEILVSIEVEDVASLPMDIPFTANIYGPHPSNALHSTHSGIAKATVPAGKVSASIPFNGPEGFYNVELLVEDPNACGVELYQNSMYALGYAPGTTPCIVYPGDVNNDGIVNYGDKKALSVYIHDANLSALWLKGPQRIGPRHPVPLAGIEHIGQAALPWQTALGCYMDTDGSGDITTFDNIAIRTNWMQNHTTTTPKDDAIPGLTFHLSQNYPNPFNPSTRLSFSVPEPSAVRISVSDLIGKELAVLTSGTFEPGVRTITFNADDLPSGTYVVSAVMEGLETGLTYTKLVRMTLSK